MIGALLLELAEVPELRGAACRENLSIFDAAITSGGRANRARRAAREVCVECSCLWQCRAWVEGLPKNRRPRGIVGGRLVDETGRFPADEARRRRHAGK